MSDEIKADAIAVPSDAMTGTITYSVGPPAPVKRYWSTTGALRWFKGVLQQEWIEQDCSWIDWVGPHPVYEWRDVPTETETN